MSAYYAPRYTDRYFSKIDEAHDFASSLQARAFDLKLARSFCTRARFDRALRESDDALVRALRFLADEIQAVIPPPTVELL